MPAAMVADVKARGHDELAAVFEGPVLQARLQAMETNVDGAQAGDIRYLAAGVKNIDIADVVIDGDSARVHATATVWTDVGQVQPGGTLAVAHPENEMIYTLTLGKTSGTWFVVDESITFAPGSEP